MTADRFGAIPSGEYTALASVRDNGYGRSIASPDCPRRRPPCPVAQQRPRADRR